MTANSSTWLLGGAALGVLAGFWRSFRGVVYRIATLFVVRCEFDDFLSLQFFLSYMVQDGWIPRYRDQRFTSDTVNLRATGEVATIIAERFGHSPMLCRKGWRWLYYHPQKPEPASGQVPAGGPGAEKAAKRNAHIYFIRGSIDIYDLLERAWQQSRARSREWFEQLRNGRFTVPRFRVVRVPEDDSPARIGPLAIGVDLYNNVLVNPIGISRDDIGLGAVTERCLDKLFYPEAIEAAIDEVRAWLNNRELYTKLGIPWRHGILLHGDPGTGKTAFVAAMAHDLDLPVFSFQLAALSNAEFTKHWRNMLKQTPCIALIEDIDNVFHGRKNITGWDTFGRMWAGLNESTHDGDDADDKKSRKDSYAGRLSFDVLLNCLSGIERADGLLTCITTNHIEHIDPALGTAKAQHYVGTMSSRPGRLDRVLHFGPLSLELKKRMASTMLADYPEVLADLLAKLRIDNPIETGAQFQFRIGQLAIQAERRKRDAAGTPATA